MDDERHLERHLDLPRGIVWEALVDPVLTEGWLHPTATLLDDSEQLEFVEPDSAAPAVVHVVSDEFGDVRVSLTELEGGTRGTSTLVRVTIRGQGDARFRAPVVATWRTRLDQLEELLRGHPVDWDHWERDHRADYEHYLDEARSAI